jgi:tetratricopeptide (TPR) repeat protein
MNELSHAFSAYRSGNLVVAERICQQLLSVDGALFDAAHLLGVAQWALGKKDAALASYDRALALRPDHGEAVFNRSVALYELKRYEEALASYDRALALRPDHAVTLSNRGAVLYALGRFEEALASYDRALALQPGYVAALSNRGVALRALRRFEEALASYDQVFALHPDHVDALSNRGDALVQLKRIEEASASYNRAIMLCPDHAGAHLGNATLRLLIGDFARGWPEYEWRWRTAALTPRHFSLPRWSGAQDIRGKTILLHSEQAFGDVIQFCRYVPLVAKRAGRVILEVPGELRGLMRSLSGDARIVRSGDDLPVFDVRCPLLSLPLAFGTRLETIPSRTPYLRAALRYLEKWRALLGPKHRLRIGVSWSGRPTHKNDRIRSIKLASLLPLLELDATFISVQKDISDEDAKFLLEQKSIVHFGEALEDFSDTAALISHLDLVLSVDTSVAHLSGALAKPVWVMLPFTPDWRWLLDRNDSPWYPTARLFRQDDTRAWDNVIARVKDELRNFVQGHQASSISA